MLLTHTAFEIEYEVESTNTAYIRPFYPAESYHSSVASSSYNITYSPGLKFRFLIEGDSSKINVSDNTGNLNLKVVMLAAFEHEDHSPRFEDIAPHALFALDEFYLQGVAGFGSSWNQFGQWMNSRLLSNVDELPEATVSEIKALTASS